MPAGRSFNVPKKNAVGNIDTDTLSVHVVAEIMRIENIDVLAKKIKLRGWYVYAMVTITVVDSNGVPVSGAEVYGDWSGLTNSSDVGTTDGSGKVTFDSNKVRNTNGEFTFTVMEIARDGLTYEPLDNTETYDSVTIIK